VLALQAVIEDPETGSEATAEAIQSLTTRVDSVEGDMTALASSLVTVEAKANMASAFGSAGLVAVAAAGGAIASYRIQLAAGAAGSPMRQAGLRLDALSSGGTKMTVDADTIQFTAALFYMIDAAGTPRTVFSAASGFIDLNTNVRVGGNLIVAGTLTVGAHAASARSQAVQASGNVASLTTKGGRVSLVGRINWNAHNGTNTAITQGLYSVFRDGVQLGANFAVDLSIMRLQGGTGGNINTGGGADFGGTTALEFTDTPSAGAHTYEIKGASGSTLNGAALYSAEEIVI
jgi:hypothetical protein